MSSDVQLSGPAAELLQTIESVAPNWYRNLVVSAVARDGRTPDQIPDLSDRIAAMIEREVPRLVASLATLLATDVDEQRQNPLALFREAVGAPTALLTALRVTPPVRDAFARERFPADVYDLGPANWSDIDEALHEPGITWGAWKAMTVLRRRRDDGLR